MTPSSLAPLYTYQSLRHGTKTIRVIKLHPAKTLKSELFCNLLELKLDSEDDLSYEAISYAWEGQNPNDDQYITCLDGDKGPHRILITKNSAIALRYLRKLDEDRMLWMDSICIDQSSTKDRNHQVQLMGDTYTFAQRVLIWLGEDESLRIGPVFGLLERLSRKKVDELPMIDPVSGRRGIEGNSGGDDEDEELEDFDKDDEFETASDDEEELEEDDDDEEMLEEEDDDEEMLEEEDDDGDRNDGDSNDNDESHERSGEDNSDRDDRSNNSTQSKLSKRNQSMRKEFIFAMRAIFTVSPDSRDDDVYSWHLYTELFGRQWFNRMWTLQEIALANSNTAMVICGRHQIGWKALQSAASNIRNLDLDARNLVNNTMNMCLKLHLYLTCIRNNRHDLLSRLVAPGRPGKKPTQPQASDIFADCRNRDCRDPRDKAFSLHGICSALEIELPMPTYEKSTAQVFTEVAKAIIVHDDSLNILFHVNTPRRDAGLPSWVPDWSDYYKSEALDIRHRLTLYYQASSSKSVYSFTQNSQGLVSLAVLVDTVFRVGEAIPFVEEGHGPSMPSILEDRKNPEFIARNYEVWKAFQSWTHLVEEFKTSASPYGSDESAWETSLMQTLTADSNRGMTMQELLKDSFDKCFEQTKGFFSWYGSLNDQDGFEQALIERGMLEAPGELSAEKLGQLHMTCSLFLDEDQQRREFHDLVWAFNRGKSFFVTEEGWIGTVDASAQSGQVVAILAGMCTPVILERVEESRYHFVGYAYIHGLMKGERWPDSLDELEIITIV